MKYTRQSISGDAGEYYFAYKITSMFGFATRLLDIDLGVDGEIEIIEDTGVSTTHLIKAQVKTEMSIKGSTCSTYVSQDNIDYWKKISLPVIVFLVDLNAPTRVYWKEITHLEDYSTKGQSMKVTFDLTKDELTPGCKGKLMKIAIPNEHKALKALSKLRKNFNILIERLPNANTGLTGYEYSGLGAIERDYEEAAKLLKEVKALLSFHPALNNNEMTAKLERADKRLNNIRNYIIREDRVDEGIE
ncbi:DUF4365 domain-containing protein [Vibrio sp. RE86]|uniref:DUF4365 domain-containing protein n=1 Tax=Vibrio sp. RE86 TaxID=2607605 RepID=UPI0014935BAB|nr:DUF4365 domain-containing protein [Vibrio sp. RE86]NOH80336.1 DUF4365 domain-containing protein [Vibrio sp. RE86]